jgi:hypothetical protein
MPTTLLRIASAMLVAVVVGACGDSSPSGSPSSRSRAANRVSSTAPATTTTTSSVAPALPRRDANGYIEGPLTYVDHGLQVTLSSTQAANPVIASKGILTLGIVGKSQVQTAFTSQAQISDVDSTQYTIRIGASGLYLSTVPDGLITCSPEPVAAGSYWQAQTCATTSATTGLPTGQINEIYDPTTKVEAFSGYWTLASLYQTTVGALTGIYSRQPTGTSGTGTQTTPSSSAWDSATVGGTLCSAPENTHTATGHDTSNLQVLGTTCATGKAIVDALYAAEAAPYPASCAQGMGQGPEVGACNLTSTWTCIPVAAPGEARLDIECDAGNAHITFVEWEYSPPTSAQTTAPSPTGNAATCSLGSLGSEYQLVSSTAPCATAVHVIAGYQGLAGTVINATSTNPIRVLYGWRCQGGVNAPVTCRQGEQLIVFAYHS